MLSRIAESLFWIGRYVERAEDTARLLQTHLRLLAEDNSAAEVDTCRNLLALMSVDSPPEPTHADLLRVLGYDASEATSIFASWASARDNARRAREVIPLELWECINTTWHQLPQNSFGVAEAHTYLSWARERSALFTGIARGTMVRDEGWQFLLLGRSLEQIDMTSRMVASASLRSGGSQWPSVLRGCGGHDAFLRTYGGPHTDSDAARFLDHRRPVPPVDHARLGRGERLPDQRFARQPVGRHPIGGGAPTARSAARPAGVLRHGAADGAPRQGDGFSPGRGSFGDHNGFHQLLRRRRPDRVGHRRDALRCGSASITRRVSAIRPRSSPPTTRPE